MAPQLSVAFFWRALHNENALLARLREILRCPDCRGVLHDADGSLLCPRCDRAHPIVREVPDLIGDLEGVNQSELETQDRVSAEYEGARYARAPARRFHVECIKRMAELVRMDGQVLDAGCGTGLFFEVCADNSSCDRFIGLDLSFGMLERARLRHPHLVRGDATRLPFADGSFDTIFARSLLHHLPDPARGVSELARVLKIGGELVVLDTHKTILSDLPRRLANHGEHFDEDHKNFRTAELTSLLESHFEIGAVEYLGYVAYPLLGFPDLFDFGRILPLETLSGPLLALDRALAHAPIVRRLGWGIIVRAVRRA